MSDEPRLLHGRSQYGYTSRSSEAMNSEPEAVPQDYQRQLTRRAAQTATERDAVELRAAQDRIGRELAYLAGLQLDRRTASHVRVMQRTLARMRQ